ncbi:MAG: hypothetical protein KHW62_04575 [Clostridiales bacterium]|nr:hypothetical protein [Clostridiales bacterium]
MRFKKIGKLSDKTDKRNMSLTVELFPFLKAKRFGNDENAGRNFFVIFRER